MSIIDRTLERGLPDWSNIRAKQAIVRMSDMGELAARLGSIVTFDRRGDVVFLDGFEDGLNKWAQSDSGGPTPAVALSSLYARNGALCAKLSLGAGSGDWVQIVAGLGYRRVSRLGGEASIATSYLGRIMLSLSDFSGTNERRWRVVFYPGTTDLYYLDSAGAEVLLASGVPWYGDVYDWATLKLVGDAATGKYGRVLFNNAEYDLSGVEGYSVASGLAQHLEIAVRNYNVADAPNVLYVDDAIVTQNEP